MGALIGCFDFKRSSRQIISRSKGDTWMKNKRWMAVPVFIMMMWFSVYPAYSGDNPKTFSLTIFHSNDFHGYEPVNLSRQAWIVNQERAKNPNVLFLNAGDVFNRGIYDQVFYGELEFAELNAMNLDAFTIGNNEFKASNNTDTAQRYLFARIQQANFPILCANIRQIKDGMYLPGVKPFIVKNLHDVKIGIFGVSANRIETYGQSKGMVVEDQIEAAKKIFSQVKQESDLVIALTHIGFYMDQKLADAIPGLAVIVGGDSHTVLKEPVIKNGIPIVQAGGEASQYLGRLDLTFEWVNNAWKMIRCEGKLIPLDDKVPQDPKVKAILDSYLAAMGKKAA
jgi:2',3'-cyclic-nucleotide 2'-phosphodiesterase (5'-nucleotidase family)